MNKQKYQLALDYLIGQAGFDQRTAQVNGDMYSDIVWTNGTAVFNDAELISAYEISKKYQHVWKEFIAERNRRLAETDWWALSDVPITNDQKVYRQSLRDLSDSAEPATINGQFDISSVDWPIKPTT